MDRYRQAGSICACPPVNYPTSGQFELMHSRSFFIDTSRYNRDTEYSRSDNSQMESSVSKRPNNLENVLLGKVPAAYSHLTSHRRSPYSQGRHGHLVSAQAHGSSHSDIPVSGRSSFTQHHVQSPRHIVPQTYSFQHDSSEFQIKQEMTSYSSRHSSSHGSPSPSQWSHGSMAPPILPASPKSSYFPSSPSASSTTSESCQEEPIDLSCKASSPAPPPRSESTGSCDTDSKPSMLRNLLCKGKQGNKEHFGHFHEATESDFVTPIRNVSGTTRVTLAKKNMYPVGSRVSDWLVKIIQFSKSIPDFVNMSHNDKVSLILNSWTRMLLLYMAESNFQFAVTPLQTEVTSTDGKTTPSPDQPTMKSVETIQNFIRKCQSMNLDQKEYAFLRMAVLFNAGYSGLDRPEHVDQLNSLVQQLLKEHVQTSRPNDVMHYSRLLLCLPALYGINCKMIENLFCKHINGNMDIDMLLKEMLQNL